MHRRILKIVGQGYWHKVAEPLVQTSPVSSVALFDRTQHKTVNLYRQCLLYYDLKLMQCPYMSNLVKIIQL